MEGIDTRSLLLIAHLVGVALGVGGATVSDIIFTKTMASGKLDEDKLGTLKTLSRVVWAGVTLLLLSGPGFLLVRYLNGGSLAILESARFQAKLTLVALIVINGLVFHFKIFPMLRRLKGKSLANQLLKTGKVWWLAITGAVSVVSWYSVIFISVLRGLTLEYWQFLAIHASLVLFTMIAIRVVLGRLISRGKLF